MIYGPNPDDTHDNNPDLMQQIFAMTAGATLERLPVQYEVTIVQEGSYEPTITIKAYSATEDDAEAVARFARKVVDIYRQEDISE